MRVLIAILAIVFVSACTPQEDSSNDLNSEDSNLTPLETTEHLLEGTWSKACQSTNNQWFIETIAFSGVDDNFAIVTKDYFYGASGCNAQSLLMVRTQSLSVSNMESNGSGYTYNATVVDESVEAVTPAWAAELTANKSCGYTWVAGQNADIMGSPCATPGTLLDTISLTNGDLYRALDEVLNPTTISGTIATGVPYIKTN